MKLIFGPFSVFPPQERKKEKNQQHQQINLYISPFLMQIRTQLFWVNLSSPTNWKLNISVVDEHWRYKIKNKKEWEI